jgi:hypothetical protein
MVNDLIEILIELNQIQFNTTWLDSIESKFNSIWFQLNSFNNCFELNSTKL